MHSFFFPDGAPLRQISNHPDTKALRGAAAPRCHRDRELLMSQWGHPAKKTKQNKKNNPPETGSCVGAGGLPSARQNKHQHMKKKSLASIMHAFKWGSSPCRLSTLHTHGLILQPPSSERREPPVFFFSCQIEIDVYARRRTRRRPLGSIWWDVTAATVCRKKLEPTLQSSSTFPHLRFEISYGESRGAGLSCNKARLSW